MLTANRRYTTVVAAVATAVVASVMVLTGTPAAATVPPGQAFTWGGDGFGQLGNGSAGPRLLPGPVAGGFTDITDLHGGREHVVVLRSDGSVWTWGSNQKGQLGTGGTANAASPVRVAGVPSAVAVATGHYHSMALTTDGHIWAWGWNASGQLGDGTITTRRTPVRVNGIDNVVLIAAGADMSYAVRADGTAWAWGKNDLGQLGDGTLVGRRTPVRITGLASVTAIAGGRDHGLAVRADGTVWAWGWNMYGQVGDGTVANRAVPVQVLTGATSVAAGAHHSYALRQDGTVWSWGRNYRAELGDGTKVQRLRPVQVRGMVGAASIGQRSRPRLGGALERQAHELGFQHQWPAGRRHHDHADDGGCRLRHRRGDEGRWRRRVLRGGGKPLGGKAALTAAGRGTGTSHTIRTLSCLLSEWCIVPSVRIVSISGGRCPDVSGAAGHHRVDASSGAERWSRPGVSAPGSRTHERAVRGPGGHGRRDTRWDGETCRPTARCHLQPHVFRAGHGPSGRAIDSVITLH